jgi:hypothetical protein
VAAAHPGPKLNPADRMKIIGPNPAPGPTATGQPAAPTNRAVRTGLVTLVVLVLILAVVLGSTADGGGDGREIDFTDLSRAAANGQITKATVLEWYFTPGQFPSSIDNKQLFITGMKSGTTIRT